MAIISLSLSRSALIGMLPWAFRQRDKTGKRHDIMAESLFSKTREERNSKFLWGKKKNIEKVHSKRKTYPCAVEGKNLSALLRQILKGNNNL